MNVEKQKTQNGVLYYSGCEDWILQYGVDMLISSELKKYLIDFAPLGDRLRILTTHRVTNIIQAYAPTGDKSDEEMKEFYCALENTLYINRGEINMFLRNFNTKIGKGRHCKRRASKIFLRRI